MTFDRRKPLGISKLGPELAIDFLYFVFWGGPTTAATAAGHGRLDSLWHGKDAFIQGLLGSFGLISGAFIGSEVGVFHRF